MTLIEFLVVLSVVGNIVLNIVVLLTVRDALHTFLLRESARRLWEQKKDGPC